MIKNFFLNKLLENTEFELTNEQKSALMLFTDFLFDNEIKIFIIDGHAGTGKTTLIKNIVKTLYNYNYSFVLLAPTGRSAKILSTYCNFNAYTIHKFIYKQKSVTDLRFVLNYQVPSKTIFFVDESSLISNNISENNIFGSGYLLNDLLEYVFSKDNKLVLIGDSAQLPPVGSTIHPALDLNFFQGTQYKFVHTKLQEVVRQQEDSIILENATKFRNNINKNILNFPKIEFNNTDFVLLDNGSEAIEHLATSYSKNGIENTIVLTYSNKRAIDINKAIRNQIFGYEDEIVRGESLMVVKNNYMTLPENIPFNFIANGEIIIVSKIHKYVELYGFRFLNVEVEFVNSPGTKLNCILLLDTLHSPTPSLSREDNEKLFSNLFEDYSYIKNKRKQILEIRQDKYYNALQVKYAYAITTHKSQGGQWKDVYIDASFLHYTDLSIETLKWFYTSITRATEKVYIFGLPAKFIEK